MKRISAVLLLAAATMPAAGQSTTLGPLALRLPASARALGMGNIAVAGRDDDVIFYNPSQLIVARGTSFSLARMSPGARGGTISTVTRLGAGAIGFGVNFLEYQAAATVYPLTRDDILDSQTLLGNSTLATLGYARVFKGFRVGAAAKYGADQVGLNRYRSIAGDVGVSRDFHRNYTAALSLQNMASPMKAPTGDISPPARATLGVAWSNAVGPLDVLATTSVSAMNEAHVSGGIGAEVGWSWISGYSIAGRAGYRQPRELGDADKTAGFGFTADRVTLDVAAELLKRDRVGYRAGFRIR